VNNDLFLHADMSLAPLLHCSNGDTRHPTDDLKLKNIDGRDYLFCRNCRRDYATVENVKGKLNNGQQKSAGFSD
jgi:hypothetical protein